jgi:hypothetical protein
MQGELFRREEFGISTPEERRLSLSCPYSSSLGSFIVYNCVGDRVPELRWGVFNTGGDIAQGLWNMSSLQQAHAARGWSLPQLVAAAAGG